MTLPKTKNKESNKNTPCKTSKLCDKNINCSLCDVRFTQRKALYVHLRNKHHIEPLEKKQGTVQCPECKNMFYDKYNLRRHCRRAHGTSPIRSDKKLFLRGRVVDTNRKPKFIHDIEKDHLKTNEKFLADDSYNQDTYSSEVIICDMCHDKFTSKTALIRHIEEIHTKNSNLRCLECYENFRDKRALMQHTHFIENYDTLMGILPEIQNYKYEVAQHVQINETSFVAEIYCNLSSREEANIWLDKFQRKNKVTFRKMRRQCQSFDRSYEFIVDRFRCQHNTLPKRRSTPHAKHTGCSATLFIRIYQHKTIAQLSWSRIRIKHTHNHLTDAAAKFRDPVEEVVNKFRKMFQAGKGPKAALNEHTKDLQLLYGEDVFTDRGICPTSRWVYNFYRKMTKQRFETNVEKVKSKLKSSRDDNSSQIQPPLNIECYENQKFLQSDHLSGYSNSHCLYEKPGQEKSIETISPLKNTIDSSLVVSSMNLAASSDKTNLTQSEGYLGNKNTSTYLRQNFQHDNIPTCNELLEVTQSSIISRQNEVEFQKSRDHAEIAKQALHDFDQAICEIRSRVSLDPMYFFNAMKNFVQTYNSTVRTPESLNSALYTFAKYSEFPINQF